MGETPLIVTGSTGRLGRLLRLVWRDAPPAGLRPIWQVRRAPAPGELAWDILADPPPHLPRGAVILNLAGSTSRDPARLAEHAPIAARLAALAGAVSAALLHASSAAVYGPGTAPHDEDDPPAPPSDYGRAKRQAELALRGAATCLRIGNIAGADAILGSGPGHLTLDPVPGTDAGPVRSYIGPLVLAQVLARVAELAAKGAALPPVLNIAQAPPVGMADLLRAAGRDWSFGPETPRVLPRVELATDRLQALLPGLRPATPGGLVAELALLNGAWP